MKNYLGPGVAVNVPAPAAVKSGDGLLVGTLFGYCGADAALNEIVALHTAGEYKANKATGQAWAVGQTVYWDDGAKKVTTASTSGNTKIGVAIVAALSADVTGSIRLNGSYFYDW
jgi:predicted RecA/RadA family phage recombinase